MKTKAELNELKNEYEALSAKLKDLNEEELLTVTGGTDIEFTVKEDTKYYNEHIYTHDNQPHFEPKFD